MVNLIKFILSLFFKQSETIHIPEPPTPIKPVEKEALIKKETIVSQKVRHSNTGTCEKCEEVFNKFPGFHEGFKSWFQQVQKSNPDAHISCAGRGKLEQEEYFVKKTSLAHFGQSSHNFNAAIDIFRLHQSGAEWKRDWFESAIKPSLDSHNAVATFKIKWYGEPGSKFFELPHFELHEWKQMVKDEKLKLVEPI